MREALGLSDRREAVGVAAAALCAVASLFCLLVGGETAEIVFAWMAAAFPVALIGLGASRTGRLGWLGPTLALLLALLEGSVLGLLVLRGRVLDGPWLGDLPLGLAIQLGGLGLAPLLLVALAYGLTFDRHGLRPGDLERLRRERAAPGRGGA